MKKNVQAGLIASLLLAPGIVAHASEPAPTVETIPYNTVASVDELEQLVNFFGTANESSTPSELTLQRARLANLNTAEEALLGEDALFLIEEKITYLEAYNEFKARAASVTTQIAGLTLTNGTLIAQTEKADTDYEQLLMDVIDAENTLEEAANGVVNGPALLASLLYYGGNGPTNFLTAAMGATTIATLESRALAIVEPKDYIATYIAALTAASTATTLDGALYESATEQARTELEALSNEAKMIAKAHVLESGKKVEAAILEAETNLVKAVAVEDKVAEIQTTTFTSAATFKTKMNAVKAAYETLTPLQKNLVSNWATLADYNEVIAVIDGIDAVKVGAVGYREKVTGLQTQYEAIGDASLQAYVTNYPKVETWQTAIENAKVAEQAIDAITIGNAATQVTAARAAYNALSSADKKHVHTASVTALTTWEKSSSTAAAVVKNINAIVVSESDFVTKTSTALGSWSKIVAPEGQAPTRDQQLVTNSARLLTIVPYAEIANEVIAIKLSSGTLAEDFTAAKNAFANWPTASAGLTAADTAQLAALKQRLQEQLTALEGEVGLAGEIISKIEEMKASTSTIDLVKLAAVRDSYTSLTSEGKKLVTNSADLTALEKQYSAALNVVTLINKLDILASDFARKVLAAQTAYQAITPSTMKASVTNYSVLQGYVPVAQLMVDIDALRPTTQDFREKVQAARSSYNAIAGSATAVEDPTTAVERLVKEYLPKLYAAERTIQNANHVVTAIEDLKLLTGQDFMYKLQEAQELYKSLSSTEKKNVTNLKDLLAIERDYKAALKVFNLIENLPATTDKSYAKRVMAAEKAYQKLDEKQKGYVHNYEDQLKSRLKIADLIGRIDKLKVGSKTYEVDVAAIRAEYEGLMEQDQALIHNYSKLIQAEENMSEAEVVEELIEQAVPAATDYLAKLTEARKAYEALEKSKRKLVSNYKELTARERTVKPILKLSTQIDALDPVNTKQFISRYKTAKKAYDKLTTDERKLLTNEETFIRDLKPIYDVVSLIASIKSTSKTFVADTQKARALYEALPAEKQAQVSNIHLLAGHELNVDGGAKIDELIKAIETSEPKERITKIKEARDAFDALDSKNRKAVTLINTLKEQEKYVKPVEQVSKLIEGLSNPRNNLNKQADKITRALQKLNAEQTSFITNMTDYMDLSEVLKVYQLIEKLKPSDQYYLGNLQAAKAAYSKLTATEKHRVTNYMKLQESEINVAEVQKVYNTIATLSPDLDTYLDDLEAAEEAYKELPSGLRKQVTNYDELKDAQKSSKAAQGVISKIDKIDPKARSFESKVKAAVKAYEKLTQDQKELVTNYNLLRSYKTEVGL